MSGEDGNSSKVRVIDDTYGVDSFSMYVKLTPSSGLAEAGLTSGGTPRPKVQNRFLLVYAFLRKTSWWQYTCRLTA